MDVRVGELNSLAVSLCVGLVAASGQAGAAPLLYDCAFEQIGSRGGGWIGEKVLLVHNPDDGSVEVFDPLIRHFVGSPIQGQEGKETGRRIQFNWKIHAKGLGNQSPVMNYTLTVFKDTKAAQISVEPAGYDNIWTGSGSCKTG